MGQDQTHTLPKLLMLTGSFPDPRGPGEAARAWRLICSAAQTHQVYLVSSADRPINYQQWRRVAERVGRVEIAPGYRRWFSPSPVCGEIKTWVRRQRFDILLATSYRVWPVNCPIEADTRLCDLTHDLPWATAEQESRLSNPRVGEPVLPGIVKARMARVIRTCDSLLVCSQRQADVLRGHTTPVIRFRNDELETGWPRHFGPCHVAGTVSPSLSIIPLQPKAMPKAA